MLSNKLAQGTVHTIPTDLEDELQVRPDAFNAWQSLTSLGRNEWICWIEGAKLIDTRARRIKRTYTEISEGSRRPCCWPGCIHRIKNGK